MSRQRELLVKLHGSTIGLTSREIDNVDLTDSRAADNLLYALNEAGLDGEMEARFIADLEAEYPGQGAALGRAIQTDFYTLKAELDAQARAAAIAQLDAEDLFEAAAGSASAHAATAAGSVNFAAGATAEAYDSSSEGTFTVSGSTFPAVELASKLPFDLPDRPLGTFASDELGLMSAAAPSRNSGLTLEAAQRVYGNHGTVVLNNGGIITPDAAAFLEAHKMTTSSFPEATATLSESGISILPASEAAAAPAPAGEVATLGEEALPEGE